MQDSQKVVELIRKLLALSKSDNEYEASLALEKAQELLDKHNLSIGEVNISNGSSDEGLVRVDYDMEKGNWKRYLVDCIARNNMCKVVLLQENYLALLGRAVNVAAVKEMSLWLISQLEKIVMDEMSNVKNLSYDPETKTFQRVYIGSKQQWKNDFLFGAIDRIRQRLKESRQERVTSNSSITSLVINREAEVYNFFREIFPHTHKTGIKADKYSAAYSNGVKAGNEVSIIAPSCHISNSFPRLNPGR